MDSIDSDGGIKLDSNSHESDEIERGRVGDDYFRQLLLDV